MKDIYIFTNSYPYKKSVEVFIEKEIEIAAEKGYNLYIIPTNKDRYIRPVPKNVTIMPCLLDISLIKKAEIFMQMIGNKHFWKMFHCKEHHIKSIKNVTQGIKYFYGAYLTKNYIKNNIKDNAILYSYWFSYTALGFAISRKTLDKLKNISCISRGHGYDIFDDLRGIFIPYRRYTLENIDKIYSVSQTGADYLESKFPEMKDKIAVKYLGIIPMENKQLESLNKKHIEFISCSSVIPLKRVQMIFDTINKFCKKNSDFEVSWTHIGDGILFEELNKSIEHKSLNLNVKLKGFLNNEKIRDLYSKTQYDIFLNFSTTEGIPVSIMEAISASIPIIATNVGGTKEIVCEETGVLIPINFSDLDFENAVNTILKNKNNFRNSTLNFFNKNFDAYSNYTNFYNEIEKI